MRRILVGLLSVTLGLVAAAAAVGIVRTSGVTAGPKPQKAPNSAISKRQRALDREALALRKARARRPPKLPKVPKFAHVHIPAVPAVAQAPPVHVVTSAPAAPQPAASKPVVYKRPPAVVRYTRPAPATTTPSTGHEDDDEHEDDGHEGEHEGGGGGDD
jgi:hypothetical protein